MSVLKEKGYEDLAVSSLGIFSQRKLFQFVSLTVNPVPLKQHKLVFMLQGELFAKSAPPLQRESEVFLFSEPRRGYITYSLCMYLMAH